MVHMHNFERMLLLASACLMIAVTSASADEWNDRTLLTFSAPVKVPGATLQPGTYEFTLADPVASRHTVRITRQGGGQVAIVQAIPIKRRDASGDVTLTFNPTDGGPVALKAWYYPGSVYGHQLLYSESEARDIADRSRTVVLSAATDGPGGEGTLFTVNPGGSHGTWQTDPATQQEWEAWRKHHQTNGNSGRDGSSDTPNASAPMIQQPFTGTRVALDTLEDNPNRYIGQAISVDGKVERVLGPRLFTIDEPHWIDVEGEILVLVPSPMAALVREDDRITVSGTMKPFVQADFERETG